MVWHAKASFGLTGLFSIAGVIAEGQDLKAYAIALFVIASGWGVLGCIEMWRGRGE